MNAMWFLQDIENTSEIIVTPEENKTTLSEGTESDQVNESQVSVLI